MWSLTRTELTRLRWRRAVVVLLLAMLVVPGVIVAAEAWDTRPFSAAEIAQAERDVKENMAGVERELEACATDPGDWGLPADLSAEEVAAECESMMGGASVEDWLWRSQLEIESFRTGAGVAVVTVLGLLAGLVGATFAGHDWASGSMSNQLLFESRRSRVWSAKALAVVLATAVTAALVLGLVWLTVWSLAEARDITASAGVWDDVLWTQVRGVALVSGIAAAGYGLTMLFRSTVGAVGLMFGVALLSSILLAALLGDDSARWMVASNANAMLVGGFEYWVGSTMECTGMQDCNEYATLTATHGSLYLGVLLLVVLVPSLLSFRRRDLP